VVILRVINCGSEDRLYGLQCGTRSIWKQPSKVSYILSGIGHPPHIRVCVSSLFCALLSSSSLNNLFLWCCLLLRCISFVSDLENGGSVSVFLYMSCNLPTCMFSMVHMGVPFVLCKVICVCFVGCCVSS
jgi:hypothetical protein